MSKIKHNKVISGSNLPMRLPIWSTLITLIALDHWHAPQWLYGALGFFFLIVWIVCIYGVATQEKVDLLKNED